MEIMSYLQNQKEKTDLPQFTSGRAFPSSKRKGMGILNGLRFLLIINYSIVKWGSNCQITLLIIEKINTVARLSIRGRLLSSSKGNENIHGEMKAQEPGGFLTKSSLLSHRLDHYPAYA